MHLHLLSGGAAQGLVAALSQRLGEETGATIAGSFGAVGAKGGSAGLDAGAGKGNQDGGVPTRRGHTSGCQAGAGRTDAPWAFALALLLFLRKRRR